MGIETSYVCDECGRDCSKGELESTFIVSIRQPLSDDIQTFFACSIECFHALLQQIQVDLTEPTVREDDGAQDAPESTGKAN
jgi:hypothetical protein